MYVYIYIYVCMYMYVCMCMHMNDLTDAVFMYTKGEREREEGERKKD